MGSGGRTRRRYAPRCSIASRPRRSSRHAQHTSRPRPPPSRGRPRVGSAGRAISTARADYSARATRRRGSTRHDDQPPLPIDRSHRHIAPTDVRPRRGCHRPSARPPRHQGSPDPASRRPILPPRRCALRVCRETTGGGTLARPANSIADLPRFSSTEVWRRLRDAKPLFCYAANQGLSWRLAQTRCVSLLSLMQLQIVTLYLLVFALVVTSSVRINRF